MSRQFRTAARDVKLEDQRHGYLRSSHHRRCRHEGRRSYALENVSGNIANSQTTAYKRIDTTFEDLIPDGIPSKQ